MVNLFFVKNGDQNERVESENIWRERKMESGLAENQMRLLSHRNS